MPPTSTDETNMSARPPMQHLEIPIDLACSTVLPFEMQPIVQIADGKVAAYELLYRGPAPANWAVVDTAVIQFLSVPRPDLPSLFVNLSNDVLMSLSVADFAKAAAANELTFELSEAISGYAERTAIAERANEIIASGTRMALDDFGAGRDGLERLYAIGSVSAVKIDRQFLLTCMQRPDATRVLRMLVAQWRCEGVKSIAEGVGDKAMYAFAKELEVDLVQGWFVDHVVASNRSFSEA